MVDGGRDLLIGHFYILKNLINNFKNRSLIMFQIVDICNA